MLLDTKAYTGQLYWRCRAGEPEACYDIYIAPSFSWASVPSALTAESLVWGTRTLDGEDRELLDNPPKATSADCCAKSSMPKQYHCRGRWISGPLCSASCLHNKFA